MRAYFVARKKASHVHGPHTKQTRYYVQHADSCHAYEERFHVFKTPQNSNPSDEKEKVYYDEGKDVSMEEYRTRLV